MSPDFILNAQLSGHVLRIMKVLNEGKVRVEEKYNKFVDLYDGNISSETKNMQGGIFVGEYSGKFKDDPEGKKNYAKGKAAIWTYVTKFFEMYSKDLKKICGKYFSEQTDQLLKKHKQELASYEETVIYLYKKGEKLGYNDEIKGDRISNNWSAKQTNIFSVVNKENTSFPSQSLAKTLEQQRQEISFALNGKFFMDADDLYNFAFEHQKKWQSRRGIDERLSILKEYNFEASNKE